MTCKDGKLYFGARTTAIRLLGTGRIRKGFKMTVEPKTVSVPDAGREYFGLSRNASYAAAERGDIPTIRIGRLLRVPVRILEKMLDEAASKTNAA
jgi:hypothetical protein